MVLFRWTKYQPQRFIKKKKKYQPQSCRIDYEWKRKIIHLLTLHVMVLGIATKFDILLSGKSE